VTKAARWLIRLVDVCIRGFISLAVFAIMAIICVQVFFRFVLNDAMPWPEEAARFLMIWSLMLAAAYAYFSHDHARIDFLFRRLPSSAATYVTILIHVLVLGFMIGLIVGGTTLVERMGGMPTGALRISRGVPFAAIPVSAVLFALISVRHIVYALTTDEPLWQ
jgi:TRAP-type C4-dicarboxylate transport system permease small subunit